MSEFIHRRIARTATRKIAKIREQNLRTVLYSQSNDFVGEEVDGVRVASMWDAVLAGRAALVDRGGWYRVTLHENCWWDLGRERSPR